MKRNEKKVITIERRKTVIADMIPLSGKEHCMYLRLFLKLKLKTY